MCQFDPRSNSFATDLIVQQIDHKTILLIRTSSKKMPVKIRSSHSHSISGQILKHVSKGCFAARVHCDHSFQRRAGRWSPRDQHAKELFALIVRDVFCPSVSLGPKSNFQGWTKTCHDFCFGMWTTRFQSFSLDFATWNVFFFFFF